MLKYNAYNAKPKKAKNCMGTALYLLGIIKEDRDAYDEEVWKNIDPRDSKTEPSLEHKIAIWPNKDYFLYNQFHEIEIKAIDHIGIVTSLDPIRITHRVRFEGPFRENQPLKDMIREYGEFVLFYRIKT
ncbi:MAG: hypothetical protein ACP5NW_01770 [Candidatus Woesearchaeota archaeon]